MQVGWVKIGDFRQVTGYILKTVPDTRTHTHTRLTALCPGLPRWASTEKVKPIWILLEQETVSGSGISWAIICHMQIYTSLQTNNHTSTPPLSFLQAGCPSCRPTNSVKGPDTRTVSKKSRMGSHMRSIDWWHCHDLEWPLSAPNYTNLYILHHFLYLHNGCS